MQKHTVDIAVSPFLWLPWFSLIQREFASVGRRESGATLHMGVTS